MLAPRPRPHPRRRIGALALTCAIAGAMLTGCGTSGSTGSSGAGASGGQPVRGGTVNVGFENEPTTLDPANSNAISSDRNVLSLFYESLLSESMQGKLGPGLATSWDTTNPRRITMQLRKGVTFSDGTPFDAKAVVANLRRVMDPKQETAKAPALAAVDRVRATGADAVTIDLKRPDPLLLVQLAHEPGMMASPKAIARGGTAFGRHPVGTGPFVFTGWQQGVSLTAKRNPTYWRKAKDGQRLPYLDSVTYRFITDQKVSLAEMKTGQLQLVFNLPPEYTAQLSGNASIDVQDVGRRRSYYVALNVSRKPFDDERVRRAFAMAVERDQIGKVAAAGQYELSPSFATKTDWFYDSSIAPPKRDPAAAKQLLAQAGYPNGIDVGLIFKNREPDPTIGQLLQAQLKEAGFRVKLNTRETQSLLTSLGDHDFDAGILTIDVPRIDPSLTFDPYFRASGPNNWSDLKDPQVDRDLAEAVDTADQAKRKQLYVAAQQRIVSQSYWVFLHQPKAPIIHSSRLHGLTFDVDRQWRLGDAWIR